MELKGTVIHIGDTTSGTSQAGKDWQKFEFTIQHKDGNYDKHATFTAFGKAYDECKSLIIGDEVEVMFNIDSREGKGRWFSSLSVWKCKVTGKATQSNKSNDLPF